MTAPRTVRRIAELQGIGFQWRRECLRVGMVPTMGALHAGHLALVRAAREHCDRVVVTLFVNPAQFAPSEDLASYPRSEQNDLAALAPVGIDVLFAPDAGEMYPSGFDTRVFVGGPSVDLEGAARPGFFGGVATVVTKLLLAGMPHHAFFGEKDFQQLLVVRQLVRDLNLPTEIVACPTVREPDGLALSSRNAYLNAAERAVAPTLHRVLADVAGRVAAGADAAAAIEDGRGELAAAGFAVDYLELRDAASLAPIGAGAAGDGRLLAAARLGRTRLIDNVAVRLSS